MSIKLFEYNNCKVTTIEALADFIKNGKYDSVRNGLRTSGKKNVDYFHVPCDLAVSTYGLSKDYKYPTGITLYKYDYIVKLQKQGRLDKWFKASFAKELCSEPAKTKAVIKTPVPSSTNQPKRKESASDQYSLPIDEVYALIDRMSEMYSSRLSALEEKIDALSNSLSNSVPTENVETANTENIITYQPTVFEPIVLKEGVSFDEWNKAVRRAVNMITGLKEGLTESSVLSNAYSRIRAQYGIVWEQESKEFKAANGRGPVNTRELCWWMESNKKSYKNLLIGKLNTIFSEYKREVAVAQ